MSEAVLIRQSIQKRVDLRHASFYGERMLSKSSRRVPKTINKRTRILKIKLQRPFPVVQERDL